MAESESYIRITIHTPYLALTGELWGVYCEVLGEIDRVITAPHCISYTLSHKFGGWFSVIAKADRRINAIDNNDPQHCSDVIMGVMACQITSLTIVYSTVHSGADQRKRQSSASLAFVQGIHRWPVNSPTNVEDVSIWTEDVTMDQLWIVRWCKGLVTSGCPHFEHLITEFHTKNCNTTENIITKHAFPITLTHTSYLYEQAPLTPNDISQPSVIIET